MFLLAALSLGFLGSFHCIGMCGPIALTIPLKRTSRLQMLAGILVYNGGRVLTYAGMGLFSGLLGKGFVLAGWQSLLSILLGSSILLFLFVPRIFKFRIHSAVSLRYLEKLKSSIRKLFGIHTMRSLLFIGLLNGLLPCGLVYMGIAGSVASGAPLKGALFMAAFGAGTIPAMMAITLSRDYITLNFRERIRKAVPLFVASMAVLLILRGMNLGIPYVSPSIQYSNGMCQHECCQNK